MARTGQRLRQHESDFKRAGIVLHYGIAANVKKREIANIGPL
jgi:hypothetical protein